MSKEKKEVRDIKLAVVGGGGVGKSAITVQFIQNVFLEEYDPTIEDSYRKQLKVDDINFFLDILDTAGQEEYQALRDQYIRRCQGFLVVYDITDGHSVSKMRDFVDQILRVKDKDKVPIVLVGNKCDLETDRKVKKEEVIKYGEEELWGVPVVETSAKFRQGIDDAFIALVKEVIKLEEPEDTQDNVKKKKTCTVL